MTTTKKSKQTSKTSSLRQRISEKRRSVYLQTITEAAEHVFAAEGISAVRMQDIAAEAGISLGTLYGTVDGKQSIFNEIYETRMSEFLSCIKAACEAHDNTLASHLAVLRAGSQYFLDHSNFLRMCCREGKNWAASPFLFISFGIRLYGGASIPRDLFARGITEGIYIDEDPELLVRKMLALMQAELLHWLEINVNPANEVILDRIERQFIRAFYIKKQPD